MNIKSLGVDASLFIGAIASISVVFVVAFSLSLVVNALDGLSFTFVFEKSIALAVFSSVYALVVLFLWGIPFHILFSYFHVTALTSYLLIGLLGGPAFLLFVRPFGIDPLYPTLIQATILGVFGVITSAIFWLFAVKKIF